MELYHISRTHVDDILWINTETHAYLPEQRSSLLSKNGHDNRFKEPKNIDKISTAPSIEECVKGIWMINSVISNATENIPLAIYKLQNTRDVSLIDHTLLNQNKLVHDANNTRETWVFGKTKFYYVGIIWINAPSEHEISIKDIYNDPLWGSTVCVTNASYRLRQYK